MNLSTSTVQTKVAHKQKILLQTFGSCCRISIDQTINTFKIICSSFDQLRTNDEHNLLLIMHLSNPQRLSRSPAQIEHKQIYMLKFDINSQLEGIHRYVEVLTAAEASTVALEFRAMRPSPGASKRWLTCYTPLLDNFHIAKGQ